MDEAPNPKPIITDEAFVIPKITQTPPIPKRPSPTTQTAFAVKVKEILRSMDSAFLMEGRRIQILLPETPGGGAKVLLSRIMTLLEQVFDEDVRRAVNPKVKAGTFFYNGASRMEYGIFSATLEEALIKAKETAGNVAA